MSDDRHAADVATHQRRIDRARARARRIQLETGAAIRVARRSAGLSLRAASAAVGLDYGTLGRIERGELPSVTVVQLTLACGAVGLEFSGRAFADGDPTRDAGHLRLLSRFRTLLPAAARWRTEVPIPLPGDRRALDAWTTFEGQTVGIEAETRLDDIQAVARRIGLKKRDASLDRMVLLVADTRGNREVLNLHRETLRSAFPLDTRRILAAMREGRVPADDGIAIV